MVFQNDLNSMCSARVVLVKTEELTLKLGELYNFFSVEPVMVGGATVTHNIATYPIRKWDKWDATQKKIFLKWCGKLMDEFYPEWRDKQ